MTLVKICGITNLDDALAAIDAGADLLGFNFYPASPRYIEPREARSIIDQLPESAITVGVFVNEGLEAIENIASTSAVSVLQLHGDESPEYCRALKRHYLIKVFKTGQDFALQKVGEYKVQLIMVDASHAAKRGGTGRLSDWAKARQTRELFPTLFLAGGLSPENVRNAIAEVEPFGVDACSSLESAPGKKDHAKVRAFVAAVHADRPHQPLIRKRTTSRSSKR